MMNKEGLLKREALFSDLIDAIIDEVNKNMKDKRRRYHRGGYLTILDANSGEVLVSFDFGIMTGNYRRSYFKFSKEKALHLWNNQNVKTSHDVGWQGAVRGAMGIYSFSGCAYSGDVEEAIAITILFLCEVCFFHLKSDVKELVDYYANEVAARNELVSQAMKFVADTNQCENCNLIPGH